MTIKGFATNSGGKKHPINEKNGIKESDMNISVKGNNDTIAVGTAKKPKPIRNLKLEDYEKFIKGKILEHPPEEHIFGIKPTSEDEIMRIYEHIEKFEGDWLHPTSNRVVEHIRSVWKSVTFDSGKEITVDMRDNENTIENAIEIMNSNNITSGYPIKKGPMIEISPYADGLVIMGGTHMNNIIEFALSKKYNKIIVQGSYDETQTKFMKEFKLSESKQALTYLENVLADVNHNTVPDDIYRKLREKHNLL